MFSSTFLELVVLGFMLSSPFLGFAVLEIMGKSADLYRNSGSLIG